MIFLTFFPKKKIEFEYLHYLLTKESSGKLSVGHATVLYLTPKMVVLFVFLNPSKKKKILYQIKKQYYLTTILCVAFEIMFLFHQRTTREYYLEHWKSSMKSPALYASVKSLRPVYILLLRNLHNIVYVWCSEFT